MVGALIDQGELGLQHQDGRGTHRAPISRWVKVVPCESVSYLSGKIVRHSRNQETPLTTQKNLLFSNMFSEHTLFS